MDNARAEGHEHARVRIVQLERALQTRLVESVPVYEAQLHQHRQSPADEGGCAEFFGSRHGLAGAG